MPVDLNRLTEGWLELESDPGLFTLLLEDFGVKGVQVDEVYDLQKPIEGPVYGFIFLFKWIEERRARRKTAEEEKFVEEESIVNSIFFAQQMIPNSCATHALLSVLLNCTKVNLGPTLTQFKEHTKNMNPENKGYAIGNSPELARAHNSHAKPQPRLRVEKPHGIGGRTKEAFHFVSYVPINGRLYELDGLKPYPIDHGPQGDDWTEKFRSVITDRLGSVTQPSHDIRFSLMAVVPDRRTSFHQKLRILKTNRQIVLEALQQLVRMTHPELVSADPDSFLAALSDLKGFSSGPRTPPPPPFYPKLPPALDSHNYAKSPLMENYPTSMNSSALNPPFDNAEDMDEDNSSEATPPHRPLRINTEFLKPLSIQTKFQQPSPTASTSSTDTSSEAGSAFNSPVSTGGGSSNIVSPGGIKSAATTPTGTPHKKGNLDQDILDNVKSVNKLVVVRMAKQETNPCPSSPQSFKGSTRDSDQTFDHSSSSEDHSKFNSRLMEPHQFAPKDLLALLKTVEAEIATCEANLKDEIEKRKKYKIDDCRRTHNYDQFVCTFLSMLAEQGKLSDLVEMQLSSKSSQQRHPPAAVVAAPPRLRPKKTQERRRKARPRKKR